MESHKEEIDIQIKKIELSLKRLGLRKAKEDLKQSEVESIDKINKTTIEKIQLLNNLLSTIVIDNDYVVGSEPKLMRAYSESEERIIKSKIGELIKNL